MITDRMSDGYANSFVYSSILFVFLLVFTKLFTLENTNQPITNHSNSTSAFSAQYALTELNQIARKPHPIGSEEHKKVRDYLVFALKNLGLQVELQQGLSKTSSNGIDTVGNVENVIGILPGTEPSNKKLLVMAHYDSVPTSPGAGDNGASVAAILESLRSIVNGPKLKRDVIVLFSDAEEFGLLGANYFSKHHALADSIGLVLNFEYRGNSGPVLMFETNRGYSKLVEAYAQNAPVPYASSMLYEIYRLMGNDTDMTVFKAQNVPGLNFASIDGVPAYHTRLDSISNLDIETLQAQGDTMLALIAHFGNSDLSQLEGEDSIYFTIPYYGFVHYSSTLAVLTAICLFVLVGVFTLLAVKQGRAKISKVITAMPATFGAILFVALVGQLLWEVIVLLKPEYYFLSEPYNSHWYLLTFVLAGLASFVYFQSKWMSQTSTLEKLLGVSLLWSIFLALTLSFAPGISYIFTWPLVGALGFIAYSLFKKANRNKNANAMAALVSMLPALAIFTPMVQLIHTAMGSQLPFITLFVITLAVSLLIPWIDATRHRWVNPIIPFSLSFVFLGIGLATTKYDENTPLPTNLLYVFDGTENQAYWISRGDELDEWTKQIITDQRAPKKLETVFGTDSPPYWAQETDRVNGISAPSIELLSSETHGVFHELVLKIQSNNNSHNLALRIDNAQVVESYVEGQKLTSDHQGYWRLNAYAMGDQPLEVKLVIDGAKPFKLRLYDEVFSFPKDLPTVPRPDYLMPSIFGSSDTTRTVIVKEYN